MSFPFSSRGIATLIKAITAGYSHATMGTLMLDAGADRWEPHDPPNKEKRLQDVFKAMRTEDSPAAETAALALAATVLSDGAPTRRASSGMVWFQSLRDALAADGWEYDEDGERLVSSVPGLSVATETTALEDELSELGWTTASGHYRQALDACSAGNWASANSQLRSLLEEFLLTLAESFAGRRPKEVYGAIDTLQKKKLLVEGEVSLLRGLWTVTQSRGAHPGLSNEEEARFRLMVVTAHCRFLLARLAE